MKNYAEGGMTPAELAAMRLNKGKTTEQLLEEDKKRTIKRKMDAMGPTPPADVGATRPGVSKSLEDMNMDRDTDAGYEYATKMPAMKKGGKVKKYAKGGSVSSASKRADGCATKGKTKGRMI